MGVPASMRETPPTGMAAVAASSRLGTLSTHVKDAVFVLDQTHSNTHR
jgi:hypothetical protein